MENVEKQTLNLLEHVVRTRFNGNASEASRFLKLKTETGLLRKWLSGERSPTLSSIAPVFEKLGVSLNIPGEKMTEYSIVTKRSAKAGAGSSLETEHGIDGFYAFRTDWLHMIGIHPDNAILLDVTGDSMEPLLRRGDTILIDTGDQELLDGKIYVVTLQDELLVKRVQKEPGGIWLCSENKAYDRIVVPADHHEWLHVHGRVRWYGREI